jgi:hypothetical protein
MANEFYENEVIENRFDSVLETAVDMNAFITVDTSLATQPGNIKQIHRYSVVGNVEDLGIGDGNTGDIEVTLDTYPYEVGTTQGRFSVYDEQVAADPLLLDSGIRGSAETMVNDLVAKAMAEFGNATLTQDYAADAPDFDEIVDGIALLNVEAEEGYFIMINPTMKAALRKTLKDDLKYSDDFVRSGYIGSVAGVPVIVSKAVPADTAFLANNQAVTAFVKKGSEVEQERDANTRKTTYYIRKAAVVALTDATKVVAFAPAVVPAG